MTSREPAAWTLTADVEWLAASADTGQTPAGPTILVGAYLLDDGVHTGNLTFTSVALESIVQVPVVVTITNRAAYFDTTGDDAVNVVDIMQVAARFATDNSQAGFSYRHDIDRDGDIDVRDVQLIALRWRGSGGDTPAGPDLIIESFDYAGGDTIPVETPIGDLIDLTVHNAGTEATGSFAVGFYISDDPEITTDDTLLQAGREFVGGLSVGQSTAVNLVSEALMPGSVPPGPAYLGAIVDELGGVGETDEANNTDGIPVTVQ